MKVFLHIGSPRTGTTSIQKLLTQNRDTLAKQGVWYPDVALLDPKKGIGQHHLAFSLLEKYPGFIPEKARMTPDQAWSELASAMKKMPKKDTVVLSSEAFSSIKPEGVKYIFKKLSKHDVKVIYVRRSPESWRKSMQAQQIIDYPFNKEMSKIEGGGDVSEVHLAN